MVYEKVEAKQLKTMSAFVVVDLFLNRGKGHGAQIFHLFHYVDLKVNIATRSSYYTLEIGKR